MKPTIYTIAERAGVSIATVSRALNDSPRISHATRSRILQIAHEVGYSPNAAARGLALKATETLALVFPGVAGPFFSEFINGAESVARQSHYHLLVYSTPEVDEADPVFNLLPARTDGMVLGTSIRNDHCLRQLDQRGFPFVLLGHVFPGLEANSIHLANEAGAAGLTRHLVEDHRYQRIVFISGPEHHLHSSQRLQGFLQVMAEYHLPVRPDAIVAGNFDEASGYAAAQKLFQLADLPQAIIAANDQMAIGALAAASERGYRVPEDVAIVGFDDLPTARYLRPPLTTVSLAIFEQGAKAIELLLHQIAHPELPPQTITIPAKIVIRHSCGCTGSSS